MTVNARCCVISVWLGLCITHRPAQSINSFTTCRRCFASTFGAHPHALRWPPKCAQARLLPSRGQAAQICLRHAIVNGDYSTWAMTDNDGPAGKQISRSQLLTGFRNYAAGRSGPHNSPTVPHIPSPVLSLRTTPTCRARLATALTRQKLSL